jgi:hypothetical protein
MDLADEVEAVSPHKMRRGVVRSGRTKKNYAAGKCVQTLERVEATEKDVGSEVTQVAYPLGSHEGVAVKGAAASHPMSSDSEQTSRNEGSANKHFQKLSTSKSPSNASGRQCLVAWEDRLSELTNYRKIHGHCRVPRNYSENFKLGKWVADQRSLYTSQMKGKRSSMTLSRFRELERIGFQWGVCHGAAWEDRLSEFADYRKINGHCNVPQSYNENAKLAKWVGTQRSNYWLQVKGKVSHMTLSRIQELETLGFVWDCSDAAWESRRSELADYRKIQGHCNVPKNYSENTKLATWVRRQRRQHRLHLEGKTSPMTTLRIQALESLGFEWGVCLTAWEDRLSELADYRKIHGHCNVPAKCSENIKLANWVGTQRLHYKLRVEGKTSYMTVSRIQELESLGFEWVVRGTTWEDRLSELAEYRKIHGHCNVPAKCSENFQLGKWVADQRALYSLQVKGKRSSMTPSRIQELESLCFEWDSQNATWEDRMSALADYHTIHGHCNVPQGYNAKLIKWVATQRRNYRLQVKGKESQMTLPRFRALESLGFEWKPFIGRGKGTRKTPSLDMRRVNSRQGANYQLEMEPSTVILKATGYH